MMLVIIIPSQTMVLIDLKGVVQRRYLVSTAARGVGEHAGSYCTPRGLHRVRARIGTGQPLGTVFVGRRPTGEILDPSLEQANPDRDWILTRILWLCGCEPGFNRGGTVDSMRRHIYIHGTPDSQPLGVPQSHGCIRMNNRDIAELFELIVPGTLVEIRE